MNIDQDVTYEINNGSFWDPKLSDWSQMRDHLQVSNSAQFNHMDPPSVVRIDAMNGYVLPHVIDAHVHVFPSHSPFGLNPWDRSLNRGVNYIVDAGSAGYKTIHTLLEYLEEQRVPEYRAFLNIAPYGIFSRTQGELYDDPSIDVSELVDTYNFNRTRLSGLKIRLSRRFFATPAQARKYFHLALELSDNLNTRLMVHLMDSPIPIRTVLDNLKSRDVVTHIYSDANSNVLEDESFDAAMEAQSRGVRMDVGCGCGGLDFDVARLAFAEGLRPNYISSDVSTASLNGPVHDLPTTMSKCLALGLSVDEIFAAVCSNPLELFDTPTLEASESLSRDSAFAIYTLQSGRYTFENTGFVEQETRTLTANNRLVPAFTNNRGVSFYGHSARIGIERHDNKQ